MSQSKISPRVIRALCADPGSSNYGFSIVEMKLYPGKNAVFKVLTNGLVENRVNALNRADLFEDQVKSHLREMKGYIEEYNVDCIIIERYMTRGIKGSTIEFVNVMIGALSVVAFAKKLKVKTLPASQWKNELKRRGEDLKSRYKQVLTTPHQLDSVLMGIYGLGLSVGMKNPPVNMDDIISQVEKTSRKELRRKKK